MNMRDEDDFKGEMKKLRRIKAKYKDVKEERKALMLVK